MPKKSLYDEFFNDKIRDVDYYLDKIKNHTIEGSVSDLFHWSCTKQFPEMVIALLDILPLRELIRLERSITFLDFETFKTVMLKNDLYKEFLTNRNNFLEYVIHHAKTDDRNKTFDFLEKLGFKLDSKLLRIAAFHGQVDLVKYFVKNKGLDPTKKIQATWTHAEENCLDEATKYNTTPDLIKYLVEELNIPVTCRHIYNVVCKDNYEALPILLNSKIKARDYSYSGYATHDIDKYEINFFKLIDLLSDRGVDMKYLKMILDAQSHQDQYNALDALKRKSDFLGFDHPKDERFDKYLAQPELDLAYDIISNYNGKENPYITRRITHNNEKYWINKMKQNPSIIGKLIGMDDKITKSYEFQKMILDIDENNAKYIVHKLHPKIINEYDHIPEIMELLVKKYNL